jgi:hypothetical protein
MTVSCKELLVRELLVGTNSFMAVEGGGADPVESTVMVSA